MLNPIDFFHDERPREGCLLDPQKINKEIINILDGNGSEWAPEISRRFTLLNRLYWSLSILDTIDDYLDYSENDILTFFVAFSTFCDVIELLDASEVAGSKEDIFKESKTEPVFTDDIINNRSDKSFESFIRALSFAHTAGVNKGGKFLKENACTFILSSIDTQSASPTNEEIVTKPKTFYFHVLLLKNKQKSNEIFKVYIDELKAYMQSLFESCNLGKIKETK
ncbi:hypothetical protein [Lactobacillus gallinarum]|uniref:hypothetical protein n=1 Tax=Lactobacillus gallinarum TaxID=52242 RepID=UPI0024B1BC9B|nr:hypothetical protein [Lactobacillus gallinarum]